MNRIGRLLFSQNLLSFEINTRKQNKTKQNKENIKELQILYREVK